MTKKRTPSFELLLSSSGLKSNELDAPIKTKIEVYHSQREIAAKATGKKALNARRLARSLETEIESDIQVQIAEGRCDDCVVPNGKQTATKAKGEPTRQQKTDPIANDIAILDRLKNNSRHCGIYRSELQRMGLKTPLSGKGAKIGKYTLVRASAWSYKYDLHWN